MEKYQKLANEYKFLLEIISSYLKKDVIISDEKTISAYTLYKSLNDEFNNLETKTSNLLTDIQYDDAKKDKFKNKTTKLFNITIHSRDNISELSFSYFNRKTQRFTFNTIYKEYGEDDIDLRGICDSKYHDRIMEIFRIHERQKYIYEFDPYDVKNNITDGFFDINIVYNQNGISKFSIGITDEYNKDDIYNRDWFISEPLCKIVENYKIELLKRIPVEVEKLDDKTKRMIRYNLWSNAKRLVRKKI